MDFQQFAFQIFLIFDVMIALDNQHAGADQPFGQVGQLRRAVFVLHIGIKTQNGTGLQSLASGVEISENAVDFLPILQRK